MKTSDNIADIAKAMALAQGQMKPASKDSSNPHFKSKYSDISAVWEAIRIPLTSNGLSVYQDVTIQDFTAYVTTKVMHISGQWIEFGPLGIPTIKKDAQGLGAAITYAKRYALCSALMVVGGEEDDDGETACKESGPKTSKYSSIQVNVDLPSSPYPITAPAPSLIPSAKISEKMAEELKEILSKDKEYEDKIMTFIKKERDCETLNDVPITLYNGIMESAKNHFAGKI